MNTYTKLKDESWGIRCTSKVSPGEVVTVTKKSGETKQETIKDIIWNKDNVWVCSIVQTQRKSSSPTKTCWECGQEFTYAECRANDGDWSDSYCGC